MGDQFSVVDGRGGSGNGSPGPVRLLGRAHAAARHVDGTPVLIVSRQVHSPVDGIRYFGLIGLLGVAAAALVAAALARRFSRPVVAAVDTTRRIASGDLDARVEVRPHEDPEFAQLAESINTMGGISPGRRTRSASS